MAENRVIQGRMVTPQKLAEMVEEDEVMEVDTIEDAEMDCPECGGDVVSIVYMPTVKDIYTGYKCQECDWKKSEESR
ncbi:MAG: DUF5795 family protein [Halobacteriaceae archaeon]